MVLRTSSGFRAVQPAWRPSLLPVPASLKKNWRHIPDKIPAPGNNPKGTLQPAIFEADLPEQGAKVSKVCAAHAAGAQMERARTSCSWLPLVPGTVSAAPYTPLQADLEALGREARALLDKDDTYLRSTAVLFRNLPFEGGADMKTFTLSMGMPPAEYDGTNRRRSVLGDDVYDVTFQSDDGMVFGGWVGGWGRGGGWALLGSTGTQLSTPAGWGRAAGPRSLRSSAALSGRQQVLQAPQRAL